MELNRILHIIHNVGIANDVDNMKAIRYNEGRKKERHGHTMKKLLVCMLALALALVLAACGGKPGPAQATPTTASAEEIHETIPAESTLPGGIDEPATTAEGESAPDVTTADEAESGIEGVPADMAGIVAYYNAALGKTAMRRTAFKRTMTKVSSWAVWGLVDEPDMQDWPSVQRLANVDETKSAPSDLVALRPDWVREASSSTGDGTATLMIRLKDHAPEEIDPKPGTYGYVGTLDKPTAEQMVFDASVILTNGILTSADVTRALFALTDGVYTVAIDTQTGKIKSVRFTGTQAADGEAKCRAVSIAPIPGKATVTLKGDMAATYLPV